MKEMLRNKKENMRFWYRLGMVMEIRDIGGVF